MVGLAEIQFPYNFFNVTENNNTLTCISGTQIEKRSIEVGFYRSVSEVVDAVRKKTADFGDWIKFDVNTNRIRINSKKAGSNTVPLVSNRSIKLHGHLALQLGFAPDTNILEYNLSPYVGNVYFGIPDQVFVYCDLIEPQLIGYQSTQVIKIVNPAQRKVNFGTSCFQGYQKIHYVPLLKKEFDKVEIDLRDIVGNFIPFQHGISRIKLHFKEKNKNNIN